MTKKIPSGFAAAREVLVLVIGILVAFWLDAAWDQRQARVREVEVLEALDAEFASARAYLGTFETMLDLRGTGMAGVLDLLRASPRSSTVAMPDSLASYLMPVQSLDVATDALEGAISSGDIGLISSRELQRRLNLWPRQLAEVAEELLVDRTVLYEQLVPSFPGDVSDLILAPPGRTGSLREYEWTGEVWDVPNSVQVRNIIAARLRLGGITEREFAELIGLLDEIARAIDDSLGK